MQRATVIFKRKSLTKLFIAALGLMMLISTVWRASAVIAQTGAVATVEIQSINGVVQPSGTSLAGVNVGDNVTIVAELSNVPELYAWQAALEYNGTFLNLTGAEIPSENVFAGQTPSAYQTDNVLGIDFANGLSYLFLGESLIMAPVAVTKGVLFVANFTVVTTGTTQFKLADKLQPVQFGPHQWDTYYTVFVDYSQRQIDFTPIAGVVGTGEVQVKPVAVFTMTAPNLQNSTELVLRGYANPGWANYTQTYLDYENTFDASASYTPDPNRRIASYDWDFGDGNTLQTSSAVITHTYSGNNTGQKIVTLTVSDDGNPAETSADVTQNVLVGLVLAYFDWRPFIYAVLAIVAVAVVVSVARSIIRQRGGSRIRQRVLT